MPINHPTLALAKNHAERLHNGGGKDYGGGHGIIVDGEKIKIDESVVAQKTDVKEVSNNLETTKQILEQTNQSLNQTQQNLSTTTQNLNEFKISTNQNITKLNEKDTDLQNQINNIQNGTTAIPVATAGKPGIVMPRQGLVVDRAGALNTTIQQYLDLTCGTVFLAPGQSKTIKIYHPCFIIYLEFYLVDSTNVASPYLLYMSNVTEGTITKGYLTATFDKQNGTYVSLTNKHTTNAMFIHYGCDDLKQTDD